MASIPSFRFDITGASGSQGLLGPKNSWRAYILPRGANASQDSTGTLITFDSAAIASRFAANNWLQVGLATANLRRVSAVGGNSLSVAGSAVTVSENNRIFLIGNTQPTVSGGSATYTIPQTLIRQRGDDTADLYTNSMITSNSDGLIQGYASPAMYDVIVQDGNQSNQGYIVDMEVGTVEGVSVTDWAFFGSTVTMHAALGVTGWATFGSSVTMHANLGVTGSAVFGGSVTVSGDLLVSGSFATVAFGNIRWAHLYAGTTSETGGIQEAINGITDASATNIYTVMLRPGVYTVDRGITSGTQTGTAGFTANNVAVVGIGTSFQSTIAIGGTITMTTGSSQVTGSGTSFSTILQIGDYVQLNTDTGDSGGTDVSGTFGRILSIQGDTQLTLEVVGEGVYTGAGGTGAGRFREFRVGDHIKAGADADTAYTRVTSIASDTSVTVSGTEASPPQTGYRGTNQAGATINKKTFYQPGIAMYGLRSDGGWYTGTSASDYINIVGMDQDSCIIRRTRSAGALTGVIQACNHFSIQNATIHSPSTRHVHWDVNGYLYADSVTFRSEESGQSAALSTGIVSTATAQSHHRVTNCKFIRTQYSVHSNSDPVSALGNLIWLQSNLFDATGTIIGLDFSTGTANGLFTVMIAGNIHPYYNVDSGAGSVNLLMPTGVTYQPFVKIYTDGALRFANSSLASGLTTSNTADYFWNSVIYPMERTGYQSVDGTSSGDVLVFNPAPASLGTTTTIAAQWPVVVCNQMDNTGTATWFPRLVTGPYGACWVAAGTTVSVGDTLVTSGTSWSAGVSNTVTDTTRIIGWAFSSKTAGTTRHLVNFRRNMGLAW
mgnify:CR=1 FL=1